MKIIAVSNQKGGCGKTTTAINLAASLAAKNKRSLLIDLDPQAHATFGCGHRLEELESSMYNVLTDRPEKRSFLENTIVPIDTHFDLAPSHILLSTIEQEYSEKAEAVSKLSEALTSLSFPYEYVVIDCPPSLGFLTFNALHAAHVTVIPIELSSFSIMGVGKLLSMVELIRVKTQHAPVVWALATMFDARTKFSTTMLEEVQKVFNEHLLKTIIRQNIAAKQSQVKGTAIHRYDHRAKSALDYFALAEEIDLKFTENEALTARNLIPASNALRIKDFAIQASNAREVHLVGDFNNWTVNENSRLWLRGDGVWQKRLNLNEGTYRYKFIVDGEWMLDPSNCRVEPNPFGGTDSVLEL